jgi:hypothetical protein
MRTTEIDNVGGIVWMGFYWFSNFELVTAIVGVVSNVVAYVTISTIGRFFLSRKANG